MIIICPCKEKKFEIDAALIPAEGRKLKCGSCDEVWFYKKNDEFPKDINIKMININCLICKKNETEIFKRFKTSVHDYTLVSCKSCSFVYLNPRASAESFLLKLPI